MLEFLIYPVSGVMKLWHLLLHNGFGIADDLAWFYSLFGLVITVRAIIAPFSWKMYKSGRLAARIRPLRAAIEEEYEGRFDEDSVREMQQKNKDLNQEYGINPLAGCIPMLIQLPTIIGLYQVLLRMARPEGGLENPALHPIGFLTADEVRSFLNGRIDNVPLPAYVSMLPEQLDFLSTTRSEVLDFVLPFLILAAIFTAANMALSIFRNLQTNDWNSPVSIGMLKFVIAISVLAPVFPLLLGLTGPFPTAIALYWFANNLWTTAQTFVMHFLLEHRYPLDENFRRYNAERRAEYRRRQSEKRLLKRSRRRNRGRMILAPHRIPQLHAENVELTRAYKEDRAVARAERKELAAKRSESRRRINQEKIEGSLARRRARKEKKQRNDAAAGTPEDPDLD
ncbi:membrane protein insertase YidC [Corynebacterium pacaense]|uniref:membrane protein insertase YidC n=1 Tax=Corynebacterium pacaense TaxID=1816684 RepID=UPI0009B97E6D|nr:membrane protein insertase YidC [Corynebacterium pacaense]